jgi:outer membrane protein TolC
MSHRFLSYALIAANLGLFAGCSSVGTPIEGAARSRLAQVGRELAPAHSPSLPQLGELSKPEDYVLFALLKHPAVFSAYSDWRAAVESIRPAGALPDPQLTFQADISNMVMSLMPGLMFDLMLPGKRAAMAREAGFGAEIAYWNYASTVVRISADLRKAWIELAFINEAIRLRSDFLAVLRESSDFAAAEYASAQGMASLEPQLRSENETGRVGSEITALLDRRRAARIQFKSALGIEPSGPDPFWPVFPLVITHLPPEEKLWQTIQAANPELARMRAMVDMAVAGETLARQSRFPDFTAGLMLDLKQAPLMWRPTATMSLPVWRGKIAAQMQAAQARREAAAANVDAETLTMAAEFARMVYMVRESDRMLAFIDGTALPNIGRTLAAAEAGTRSGMGSAAMMSEARVMAAGMRIERLNALRDRELAVADLMRMSSEAANGAQALLPLSKDKSGSQP